MYLTASGTSGIANIQNVVGSPFGNYIYGDNNDNVLTGGGGTDTLVGRKGNDRYVFSDGFGHITVIELANEGSDTLDFTAVTGALTFAFNSTSVTVTQGTDWVTHTGTPALNVENYVGGQGGNTFDFSAMPTAQSFVLASLGSSNGFAGATGSIHFDNANRLIGSSLAGDTLTGLSAASTWTVGATRAYSSTRTLAFSGIETAIGAGGADTFLLTAASTLNLDGGAGVNTLDLSTYGSARQVTLTGTATVGFSGQVSGLTGAFTNINAVIGSGLAGDTLTGMNGTATWQVGATNGYTVGSNNLTFSAIETLAGGAGSDTLVAP